MNQTATPAGGKIAVIGLGYVGCVTAACLAQVGHAVVGVDKDAHKVEAVRSGHSPFYEPGLESVVRTTVEQGLLTATVDLAEVLDDCSIALLCVGTPSEPDGNLSLAFLRNVAAEIGRLIEDRTAPLIVAIRSTVFPGTCELVASLIGHPERVSLVSNPEFLREGSAMKDFTEPSLLVVGSRDAAAARSIADLYRKLPVEPCLVSLETAELIKYACNCFHALKIGFANEIGSLAARLGIDGNEVMETLCRDKVLNVSAAYLKPGFAFGGSCLPKDLRALNYRASSLDLDLPVLASVLPSNQKHLARAISAVAALPGKLGIFGLAFKENTDDLRESPVLQLVREVRDRGREVRVWDPHIQLHQIYGTNLRYLLDAVPGIEEILAPDLASMLAWADRLVVTQKPSVALREQLQASGRPILDLAGRVPA